MVGLSFHSCARQKDKSFATGVNRSVIEEGMAMLGMELTDLIGDAILGMRQVAECIGL